MAMAHHGVLSFAKNGANRPLHQDRQVLRASDLSLEQATQDAMLARARRHLHGWGVVAGFLPEVLNDGTLLSVGAGYGVTPLGDEVFLPQTVELPDAAEIVVLCCGPGPIGCELVDPQAIAAARAVAEGASVSAWLVARPDSREAAPRAGVPDGCGHPASALLPSRRCGGVEFAVLCTLPPSHQPQAPDCEAVAPFVCGLSRGARQPLPWQPPLGPEANFIVIARLTVTGGVLSAATASRRTLWPLALIQDWISACLCPALESAEDLLVTGRRGPATPQPEPVVAPAGPESPIIAPVPIAVEPEPPPPAIVADTGADDDLERLLRADAPSDPLPRAEVIKLRDQLSGGVTGVPGIGDARTRMLARIDVTTEGQFLTAPSERLARALGMPTGKITEMKAALSARRNLDLVFD